MLIASALRPNIAAADEKPVEEIVIYGSTPVQAGGLPLDRVPSSVQRLDDGDVASLAPLSTTDFLGRRAASVHLEQTQNNPFQPDLLYRGFTSSFLLGTPQGLSIFKDGIRLNEFLGDAMNWDLVPEDSIDSAELLPGANPVYGRNTLGGAIALATKSGRSDPGTSAEVSYGSFERFGAKLSHGGTAGAGGAFDYLASGDFESEEGFREFSRSRVAHVFLRGGWHDADGSELWATYDLGRNDLRGNGTAPKSLLDEDRSAVFTKPDEFEPKLDFVTVHGSRPLDANLVLRGSGFYRALDIDQLNADVADDADEGGASDGGGAIPGVVNKTRIEQHRFGGTLQATHERKGSPENVLTIGLDGEGGDADVRLTRRPGVVTADRGVATTGDAVLATDVGSNGDSVGAYATDTFTPLVWLTITGSLRYDRTHLSIDNRLAPASGGAHTFDRPNPSAGANFRWSDRLDFYLHYGEGFRAPSAIELSCASETDPCPLPVAFSSDPPLRKVVARSYEAGLHARPTDAARASLAFFLTNVDDDIFFVSSSRSAGFFQNVDETRRLGVEATADGRWRVFRWFVNYSFTRATFESTVSLPSALGPNVAHPGDELPGVPRHLLKSGVDCDLPYGLRLGVDLQFTGRQRLRGDEANERSELSSYAVANARLSYTYEHVTLFARAENLFDEEYETFGTFAANPLADGRVERFVSPGAPLGGWFGVRVDL